MILKMNELKTTIRPKAHIHKITKKKCTNVVPCSQNLSCLIKRIFRRAGVACRPSANEAPVTLQFPSAVNGSTERAVAQVVSRRLLTAEGRLQTPISLCRICGGQSGTGTGLSPTPSVFPCKYLSTAAPYSLMYHLKMDKGPVRGPDPQRHSLTPSQQ
jgi:hypothetical protein